MPLKKVHPDIEVKRPIGLCGHHTRVHPQVSIALVQHTPVALALAGDVFHGAIRQCRLVAKDKGLLYAQGFVDPTPLQSIAMQFKKFGVSRALCVMINSSKSQPAKVI